MNSDLKHTAKREPNGIIAYLQRAIIPVFRYVKALEIHQDFPEL